MHRVRRSAGLVVPDAPLSHIQALTSVAEARLAETLQGFWPSACLVSIICLTAV